MNKIVMCVWNDFDFDDRIKKKALTLAKRNNVVVKCVCKSAKAQAKKQINPNLLVEYYWFNSSIKWFVNRLIFNESFWSDKLEPADIYDCNDPDTLPAGVMSKKHFGGQLIYDSHEYWKGTRRKEYTFLYTLYSYIANTIQYIRQEAYINKADKIVCVSDSIKKLLEEKYKKPTYLIQNYSHKQDTFLDYKLKQTLRQVVFVGSKYRLGVDKFLDTFADKGYKVIVIGDAKRTNPKITYKGFIPKDEYMKILNKSWMGIAYMNVTCKNVEYSLPNKLFEYIQAGVIPIVNYNNIDSSKIVTKHGIGLSLNSDGDIDEVIQQLDKRTPQFQANLEKSRRLMNWEQLEDKLFDIYT